MLNAKVKELLNDQVNKEMYSAYLYLDFSGFMGEKGLGGFAAWYKKQAEEEMEHAFKIYDYILGKRCWSSFSSCFFLFY